MIFLGAVLVALLVVPDQWMLPVLVVGGLIEVGETFFWLWYTRRGRVKVGAETLLGASAVVVTPLTPVGQVRIQGELWRARCETQAVAGERVRVRGIDGLTLLVERAA